LKLFVMRCCLPPVPHQIDRFKALARELGCDENEAAFDAALKKIAERAPLPKHEPKKRKPKGALG
jgi:hypothetical protein